MFHHFSRCRRAIHTSGADRSGFFRVWISTMMAISMLTLTCRLFHARPNPQCLYRNEPNTAPRPLAGFVQIKGSNSSVLHWVWFGSENRNFASKRKHVQKPRCCLPHLWMVAVAWHAWPNDTRAQIGRWSTLILVKQEPLSLWLSAANGMLSLCGKCLSQWLVISEDFDMVILKESQKHIIHSCLWNQGPRQ